jgi:transposase
VAAARAAWPTEAGIGGIAPDRLVFLDECGVLTNMARLWGRSPRGARAHGAAPCGHWTRLTVLGALGIGGMVAAMATEAATDGAVFHAWLERVLLPELRRARPDAVLVLDNLRAHKTRAVRDLLDRSGFTYRYLPSDSPDLSPLEPAWAKVKAELRRVAARSVEALHQALRPALDTITPQDASGFFRHAGYARPN